jgi:putative ABC transport system permease protein
MGLVVAAVVSAPFVVALLSRPTLRRLAIRNALRRPRESALVVLGSLLATALMTAAFVVGDSFTSSIRQFAYTQLGPTDEIVSTTDPADAAAIRERLRGFTHPDVDGVFDITTYGATAATLHAPGRARSAAPRAQLLEIDFEAVTAQFDPGISGISGPTPPAGRAVIGEDLAEKLRIDIGAEFSVFAAGASRTLVVDRILPQTGVAGLWLGRESQSNNAFVAPGTIADFASEAQGAGAPPLYSVAVSNRGGVEDSIAPSAEVAAALRERIGDIEADVVTVKGDLIEVADEAGSSLSDLYTGLSFFAVFAGILLMINIFLMLAEERRSELGMMRAMGMRRKSLIMGFASEGWLYAIVAAVLGVGVGLAVARVVVRAAADIFSAGDDEFALDIIFAWQPESLVRGAAIGLVIALATVVLTSIATAYFNVIAAIRGIEVERQRRHRVVWVLLGALVIVVGVLVLLSGFGAPQAPLIIAGVPIVAMGAQALYRAVAGRRRWAITVAGLTVLVWAIIGVTVSIAADADLEISAFVTQGTVGVIGAVLLISEYQGEIGRFLSRVSRRSLTVRLGLAYPLARRTRTAFTMGQFAIVVFVLVYISVLANMFAGQVDSLTRDISGGYDTFVKSSPANPIPVEELAQRPGVRAIAPVTEVAAEITPAGADDATFWSMISFDERMISGGAPALEARGEFANDDAAYRELLTNPNAAMVDAFFLSDNGPPSAAVDIGDTIVVKDPISGRSKELVVIAESPDDWLFNGGFMNPDAMRELFGDRAVPNRAYLDADDPASLSDAIEADYFDRGAESAPISRIVDENLAQQNQFFRLMRSFLAIGLVIGIAGIGVIMVRAVRERRRQIGVLRALGFEAANVSNAFAVESTFVAVAGTLVGVLLGFVCSWSITRSDEFGGGLTWTVPWVAIAILVAGTLVGSLLATLFPARSASKIRPSVALRIAD